MRNIKLVIEYEGTEYEGWQVQAPLKAVPSHFMPGRRFRTIQETIEAVLRQLLQKKVRLAASGRTDAGVHALAQVANFHTTSAMPLKALHRALNSLLPPDISITKVQEAPADFHSRYSAKTKLYRYTILNRPYPSALRRAFVHFCDYPLDIRLMNTEARALKGTRDFTSFHAVPEPEKKGRSSVRTIRRISVLRRGSDIVIEVEANGFLQNMVRTIVGTLIEIGRGKFPAGSAKRILEARDRRCAGPTAPARGLCLVRVSYR